MAAAGQAIAGGDKGLRLAQCLQPVQLDQRRGAGQPFVGLMEAVEFRQQHRHRMKRQHQGARRRAAVVKTGGHEVRGHFVAEHVEQPAVGHAGGGGEAAVGAHQA